MPNPSALVRWISTAALMTTLVTSRARAEEPAVAKAAPDPRRFSFTISPLHLFAPIIELTGEMRLSDKMGIAGILGAGTIKSESTSADPNTKYSAFEAGAQFRYYVFGSFRHGMQLGVEALYLRVTRSIESASVQGEGLALGPFVGYKITTSAGFTFDGQLGVQRVGLAGHAQDSGVSANSTASSYIPLLNLNVGWSF